MNIKKAIHNFVRLGLNQSKNIRMSHVGLQDKYIVDNNAIKLS